MRRAIDGGEAEAAERGVTPYRQVEWIYGPSSSPFHWESEAVENVDFLHRKQR